MVGEECANDFAAGISDGGGEEDEVEAAGGKGRGIGVSVDGVELIGGAGDGVEVIDEGGDGVGFLGVGVEVAADDGGDAPVGVGVMEFLGEVVEEEVELVEALEARGVVEVDVDDGDVFSMRLDGGVEEAFLTDVAEASEAHVFGFDDGVFGEDGVAVDEAEAGGTVGVDAEDGVGVVGVGLEKFDLVDAAAPEGVLVDFLEGDDVG